MYACAGDFKVTYEGVLRDPPYSWLMLLKKKHLNNNLNKEEFISNAIQYKLIKIPDVYKVSMTF